MFRNMFGGLFLCDRRTAMPPKRNLSSSKGGTVKTCYFFCLALVSAMSLFKNDVAIASGGPPISFTGGIRFRIPAASPEVFYEASFSVNYTGGPVILSAKPNGEGDTMVDDKLIITVIGPDSIVRTYTKDYGNNCGGEIVATPPTDIRNKFRNGINHVHVRMINKCGATAQDAEGASAFWLLP
jgi:hypothetical protein